MTKITKTKNELSAEQTKNNTLRSQIDELRSYIDKVKEMNVDVKQELSLTESRKVQSEHDKTQAELARNEKVLITNKGECVVSPKLVKDAPDGATQGLVALINNDRVRQGLAPYESYKDYVNAPVVKEAPKLTYTKSEDMVQKPLTDPVTPLNRIVQEALNFLGRPLAAAGEVYYISSGDYYVAWNKSRAYVQRANPSEVNIIVRGDRLYGAMAVMTIIPNKSFRDLTREEFDSILKGKPSFDALFGVYSRFRNCQNVVLDITKAVPVW